MSHPNKTNIKCIPYEEDGKLNEFILFEEISDRWRVAGRLLSMKKATLDKFSKDTIDDVERCSRVFSAWIKNNGQRDYPLTWEGLHKLLKNMGRRKAAEELYRVLAKTGTENNVDTLYKVH